MFKRLLVAAYGLMCYAVFFATYLYAVGFVGNLLVPRTIDGPPAGNLVAGVVVDLVLLLAFALQHSIMARSGFKRWITRSIPQAAERSTSFHSRPGPARRTGPSSRLTGRAVICRRPWSRRARRPA